MSYSSSPQEQHRKRRSPRLEAMSAEERKRCIYTKLDAIDELMVDISRIHSKMKQLIDDLEEIQTLEEQQQQHSSSSQQYRCLGIEIERLPPVGHQLNDWHRRTSLNLQFIRECIYLRCNEASMTRIDFSTDDDYKFLIGDCRIHNNTHVVDLTVQLSMISTEQLNDTLVHPDAIRKSFRALLHYVKTSAVLRRIHVLGFYAYNRRRRDDATEEANDVALLHAIGCNPNIEQVHWRRGVPPSALHNTLVVESATTTTTTTTTCQIKTMSLECMGWDLYPVQQIHLIPQAVANCKSLVRLHLMPMGQDWRLIESILNHLADALVAPLQELSISRNGDRDQLQSLTRYLEATTTLQHLELRQFDFQTDTVGPILVGLQRHYALPSACINKLSILDCKFDHQATDKFSLFLKETRYNDPNPCAVLQELVLKFSRPAIGRAPYFGAAIASSLSFQPQTSLTQYRLHNSGTMLGKHTIGSGLKILKLDPFCFMEAFCETVRKSAKYIFLPCLHLSTLGREACLQLAACIPKLLSLQELYLDKVDSEISSQGLLLSMIHQCANLHVVSIQDNEGHPYLNDSQSSIAKAFCDRNTTLPLLFSKTITWAWRNKHVTTFQMARRQTKKQKRAAVHSMDDYDIALLFPMLLHVAKQVPMTRVSTIMQALLNMVMEGIESV